MNWFKRAEAAEIKTESVQSARIVIGHEKAWVERRGDRIKISYPYAGRFTREDTALTADDIRALARFVDDTDAPAPSHEAEDGGS